MEQVVDLIIPFIVLVLLGTTVDRITIFLEDVMKVVPYLPDYFEKKLAFIVLVAISFGICWEFDFSLMEYLSLPAKHPFMGYLFTAVLTSGGSAYIRQNLDQIEALPSMLSGLTSSLFKMMKRPTK